MVENEVKKRMIAERHHCPNCGQSYKYKGGLRRHLDFECGKLPQFVCPECSKEFSRKDKLLRHRKNVHKAMYSVAVAYVEGSVPQPLPKSEAS